MALDRQSLRDIQDPFRRFEHFKTTNEMPTETVKKVSFEVCGCELACWWKSPYGVL